MRTMVFKIIQCWYCTAFIAVEKLSRCRLFEPLEKTASEKFRIGYHGCVRGQLPEFKALF